LLANAGIDAQAALKPKVRIAKRRVNELAVKRGWDMKFPMFEKRVNTRTIEVS
jgi:hypothetical protein